MPRMKKVEAAILNITTHPHSPGKYVQLFKAATALKGMMKLRGHEGIALGPHWPLDKDDTTQGIHGQLFKFVNIDPNDPWLNTLNLEPVISEDGEPVVPIPDHLKPNLKRINYVFYPRGHRLFCDTTHLSPGLASKGIYALLNAPELQEKFGEVSVTIEQTEESIEKILKIPSMTKLEIYINLPNDDDLNDAEKDVIARLKKQKAKKSASILTGTRGEGLEPDESSIAEMTIARLNGRVNGYGHDGIQSVFISTATHPKKIITRYPEGQKTPLNALIDIGAQHVVQFHPKTSA